MTARAVRPTVEFALILVPMMILIGGIIYFGIGLNYWLDMNRVANQGARWAAVNNWPPYCTRDDNPAQPIGGSGCTASGSCSTVLASGSKATLQNVLRCSTRNPSTTVTICYPGEAVGSEEISTPSR